jgi:hypothetical protein
MFASGVFFLLFPVYFLGYSPFSEHLSLVQSLGLLFRTSYWSHRCFLWRYRCQPLAFLRFSAFWLYFESSKLVCDLFCSWLMVDVYQYLLQFWKFTFLWKRSEWFRDRRKMIWDFFVCYGLCILVHARIFVCNLLCLDFTLSNQCCPLAGLLIQFGWYREGFFVNR